MIGAGHTQARARLRPWTRDSRISRTFAGMGHISLRDKKSKAPAAAMDSTPMPMPLRLITWNIRYDWMTGRPGRVHAQKVPPCPQTPRVSFRSHVLRKVVVCEGYSGWLGAVRVLGDVWDV